MKKLNDAFLRMNPDEEQRARMLEEIRQSADSARRLPLKKILAIAAAAVLCAATVVFAAVPAVKTYFVPHLGVVEVPETETNTEETPRTEAAEEIPYLFLRNVTGETSGNSYTVGYVFGDTAVLHLTTPIFEEYTEEYRRLMAAEYSVRDRQPLYEEMLAQLAAYGSETVTVEASPVGTRDGIYAECVVTFTALDRSVLTDGLSFMGDTLYFTAPATEYRSYEQQYGGVSVRLFPLSEDNTVFLWTLEADEALFYSVNWMYSDFDINRGKTDFFRFVDAQGKQYSAKISRNLLYLDTEPAAPITALQADRLHFRFSLFSEEYTIANPFVMGEKTAAEVSPALLNGETLTVTAAYEGPEKDPRFPAGRLILTGETVAVGDNAIRYTLTPGVCREYADLLKIHREADGAEYPITVSGNSKRIPYFTELGETLTFTVTAANAVYPFPWEFSFEN